MRWRPTALGLSVLACALVAGCELYPFFPATGEPLSRPSHALSPAEVIDQLLTAYQTARIDLYEEIFPSDHSFRFYVSPAMSVGTQSYIASELVDLGDSSWVRRGTYHYWSYDAELRSTQNLFERATIITIDMRPVYDPGDFRYHIQGSDTVGVEVRMVGGEIGMSIPVPDSPWITMLTGVDIQSQVFYLRRYQGEWKIAKWFDLGTAADLQF
jgi:hypothetical protein